MRDDTISRQAAIDALKEHRALYCDNTPDAFSKLSYAEKSRVDELDTAIATLVNLPSAERRGRWIMHIDDLFPAESTMECDQCHEEQPLECDDKYCPNCGSRMDLEGEEE